MRPTRRGYAVAGVVVAAVLSASLFGARGLNAIAAPGLVALAFAVVQTWRVDPPTVERELPRRGAQGSTVAVELDLAADRPYSARVTDAVGDGLAADGNDRATTVGAGGMRYELTLRGRGERTVGPVTVVARDVLGLVARRFELPVRSTVLVRPVVHPLSGPRADELVWIFGGGDDRQEFDFLRRYRRGDPVRDIHWPSSAKVPGEDLVVKAFSADEGASSAVVAAESEPGHADEMAAAAASVVAVLLAAGLRVGLATPEARLEPRAGREQRDRALDELARSLGGPLRRQDRRDADIHIRAGADGVTVELADATVPFRDVAGRPASPSAAGDPGAERGGVA
ncbi:MAG: DUF58 domain-containing protein [Halobacteriales archaeon]